MIKMGVESWIVVAARERAAREIPVLYCCFLPLCDLGNWNGLGLSGGERLA